MIDTSSSEDSTDIFHVCLGSDNKTLKERCNFGLKPKTFGLHVYKDI